MTSTSPFCDVYLAAALKTQPLPGINTSGPPYYATEGTTADQPSGWTLAQYASADVYTLAGDGAMGEARVTVQLHVDAAEKLFLPLGLPIRITERGVSTNIRWEGLITKVNEIFGENDSTFQCVCHNRGDWLLHGICVSGQFRLNYNQEQTRFHTGHYTNQIVLTSLLPQYSTDSPESCIRIEKPLCFNPDGDPNMTAYDGNFPAFNTTIKGHTYAASLFDIPYRRCSSDIATAPADDTQKGDLDAKYWTLENALVYLFEAYWIQLVWAFDFDDIITKFFDFFAASNPANNPIVSNVNLEGFSFAQALTTLLSPYGYGWAVSPAPESSSPNLFTINFYNRNNPKLLPQPLVQMSPINPSKGYFDTANALTDIISANLTLDGTAIVNCVEGLGNYKTFTTLLHTNPPNNSNCCTLVKSWLSADCEDLFPTGSPPDYTNGMCTGSLAGKLFTNYFGNRELTQTINGKQLYAPGRLWLVNLGDVNNIKLEDITTDLQNIDKAVNTTITDALLPYYDHNSIDYRPTEQPGLYKKNQIGYAQQQEDVQVEMSIDSGANWSILPQNWYKTIPNKLGIVLTEPDMQNMCDDFINNMNGTIVQDIYWNALKNNTVRIRIICNIRSDSRDRIVFYNGGPAYNTGHAALNPPVPNQVWPLCVHRKFNNDGFLTNILNPALSAAKPDGSLWVQNFVPIMDNRDDYPLLTSAVNQQYINTNHVMIAGTIEAFIRSDQTDPNDPWKKWQVGASVAGIVNRNMFPQPAFIKHVTYNLLDRRISIQLDNMDYRSVTNSKPPNDIIGTDTLPVDAGNIVPYKVGSASSREDYNNRTNSNIPDAPTQAELNGGQ
jgi:hypothetical protein